MTPVRNLRCDIEGHIAPVGRHCVVVAIDHRAAGVTFNYHVNVPDGCVAATPRAAVVHHHEIILDNPGHPVRSPV